MNSSTLRRSKSALAHSWNTLSRGMGQVFFMDAPASGVLMLAGLAVADVRLALFSFAGIVTGTLTALALRLPRESIALGLHGYCAALVGGASYVTWGASPAAWVSTLAGGALAVPVTVAMATLFAAPGISRLGLCVLTAPFCVVSGVIAVIARGRATATRLSPAELPSSVLGWLDVLFTNVGQVVFADSALAGILITAGLWACTWRAAAGGLLGSLTSILAAVALGQSPTSLVHGLLGYSAVLVGISAAAVHLNRARTRWAPWAVAAVGALACTPVQAGLATTTVPVYTWPFVIVTWTVLAVSTLTFARRSPQPE